jgi:hypothetical protein
VGASILGGDGFVRDCSSGLLPAVGLLLRLSAMAPHFTGACGAIAAETSEQRLVVSVERIWDRAGHSAFTDLIRFNGQLYCTFREGSGHIPGLNGVVRVIRSTDGAHWQSIAVLEEPHVDLRDPKLSVTPDGRLMINMGASYYHGSQRQAIESRVSFSDRDGGTFSRPKKIEFPPEAQTGADWLWRVTWHGETAWGCLQQVPDREHRSLRLVKSRNGVHYDVVATLDVAGANETTLRFLEDERLLAMIRSEAGDARGSIGIASPPYTEWTFSVSNKRYGGPNLMQLPNGTWLAGSRGYEGKTATTQLWQLDVDQSLFRELLTLPSGGDTSYPGFVLDESNKRLYVSYYSSHEHKAAIYLATLRLDALVEATTE